MKQISVTLALFILYYTKGEFMQNIGHWISNLSKPDTDTTKIVSYEIESFMC